MNLRELGVVPPDEERCATGSVANACALASAALPCARLRRVVEPGAPAVGVVGAATGGAPAAQQASEAYEQ
jgi:hypothetical protein